MRMIRAVAMVLAVGVVASTVAGCRRGAMSTQGVRLGRGVELIPVSGPPEALVRAAEPPTWVPTGAVPRGYQVLSAVRGSGYEAVLGARGDDVTTAWLFTSEWRNLGAIRGIRRPGLVTWAEWPRRGSPLGVLVERRDAPPFWMEAGVVRPPATDFHRLVRLDDCQWPGALWAGDSLVVHCQLVRKLPVGYSRENVFVSAEPATGAVRTVYREPLPGAGGVGDAAEDPKSIGTALASPDGTRIAFDRVPPSDSRSGIWLLDPGSGACRQLTYPPPGIVHQLVRWESSTEILGYSAPGQVYAFRLRLGPGS
jgi:hypothetical protein